MVERLIGPEKGRYREKVARLVADAEAAERPASLDLGPPDPGRLRRVDPVALMGHATDRVEIGTAVVPIQTRHPVAMAQQALSTQAVCEGGSRSASGPSHHWIIEDMLGLPYERPPVGAGVPRGNERRVRRAGPGRRRERRATACTTRSTSPTSPPTPVMLAALAPVMLRIAGELPRRHDPLDGRRAAIAEHVVPRITKAATERGRPAPRIVAGVPVALCRPRGRRGARCANKVLGHAEYSPNYQRLLEHGDATDVGDMLAAGDEAAVVDRLRSFRDAGVTDLGRAHLPLGARP